MNASDKIYEIGVELKLSEDEISSIKKQRFNKPSIIFLTFFGSIAFISSILGYHWGERLQEYPWRIFLFPSCVITKTKENKRKLLGIVVFGLLFAVFMFVLSCQIAMQSNLTIDLTSGDPRRSNSSISGYGSECRYGVWSP